MADSEAARGRTHDGQLWLDEAHGWCVDRRYGATKLTPTSTASTALSTASRPRVPLPTATTTPLMDGTGALARWNDDGRGSRWDDVRSDRCAHHRR